MGMRRRLLRRGRERGRSKGGLGVGGGGIVSCLGWGGWRVGAVGWIGGGRSIVCVRANCSFLVVSFEGES
jgi:hypothetical protein